MLKEPRIVPVFNPCPHLGAPVAEGGGRWCDEPEMRQRIINDSRIPEHIKQKLLKLDPPSEMSRPVRFLSSGLEVGVCLAASGNADDNERQAKCSGRRLKGR